VGVEAIMDALDEQRRAGLVRRYGASNWRAERIAEANAYAKSRGYEPFAASQILFNLGHLTNPMPADICAMDEREMAWYRESRLPVFAYSSTANGYFAAGKSDGNLYENPTSALRRERVEALARRKGATPNQIAVAWVMAQPWPVIPLLGTVNPEHLADRPGRRAGATDRGRSRRADRIAPRRQREPRRRALFP
jgi:aryl-alcohol dehydrogenase-like predicted oxidoreductase